MLNVLKLKKIYHTNKEEIIALDNININLKDNEIISIIGPSGCGKSTILSILAGVEDKTDGEIIGTSNYGYMLQNDLLFDWLSIYDNCTIGLKIKNIYNDENRSYVNELLKKYDLEKFKDMYPFQLSGGMKQRAALIRTLAIKPEVLLLDEPFSQLDSKTRIEVCNDVYNIIKKEKKSAILVTHDIEEAISISDRIYLLTKCPSQVFKEYKLSFNDESPLERRLNSLMTKYFKIIFKDFDKNV